MARAERTSISTLRGRLRNVVGTIEVLEKELDQIVKLADPSANLDEHGEGCPNEFDHLLKHATETMWTLADERRKMRKFLSKPRYHVRRGSRTVGPAWCYGEDPS